MTAIQTPPVSTEVSSTVLEDVIFPPREIDSDEPQLESEAHLEQLILFLKCLK